MERTPLQRLPPSRRRRSHRQVCRLSMRGRLYRQPRHGLGPAPADDHGGQVRGRNLAGEVRLSVQNPRAYQARLQEPEMGDDDLRQQPLSWRLLGGSRLQLVWRIVSSVGNDLNDVADQLIELG